MEEKVLTWTVIPFCRFPMIYNLIYLKIVYVIESVLGSAAAVFFLQENKSQKTIDSQIS